MTESDTERARGRHRENFPVATWLTPGELRPALLALYDFARITDDIADDPRRPAADKIARLDAIGAALESGSAMAPDGCGNALDAARALRRHLDAYGVPVQHARDLLFAFAADATLTRIPDWDALMASCRLSAVPIGRMVLGFHGEDLDDPSLTAPSDSLSSALQVLDHVQDCRDDFLHRDRIYIPGDWLREAGVPDSALGEVRADRALRAVIDRCLAGADRLLADAAPLPGLVTGPRLALELGAIHALACALAARLRRRDPLAGRVAFGRPGAAATGAWGALRALVGRLGSPTPARERG